MPGLAAGGLVFTTSAAVLILEILAGRLLAPYVGASLETYSGIIGTVLAGIAFGTWAGGRLADRIEPRRLIGPMLVIGGALAISSVPVVRALGEMGGGSTDRVLVLSAFGFFPTAAVLSAVTPAVIKLQLHDLAVTGQVVGRLSALGTTGAIAGTFLAGFVLIEAAPTSVTVFSIGGLLVVGGIVVWVALDRQHPGPVAAAAAVALLGVGLGAMVDDPCQTETTYHCARIERDGPRSAGRTLQLDTLSHSYVDLADPAYLDFGYVKLFADAVDTRFPEESPLDALHLGGGAFTMPRYLEATRPGTSSQVLEIDGGLVDLVLDQLPLDPAVDLDVRVGDARLEILHVPDGSQDVVFGDAFAGLAAPWHLTTREFVTEVHRVVRPGGLYVANLIDRPPLNFTRSEAATLLDVFADVVVIAPPPAQRTARGRNIVLVASDQPVAVEALVQAIAAHGLDYQVLAGQGLAELIDGAFVLTDDRAPIDQWLARAGSSRR